MIQAGPAATLSHDLIGTNGKQDMTVTPAFLPTCGTPYLLGKGQADPSLSFCLPQRRPGCWGDREDGPHHILETGAVPAWICTQSRQVWKMEVTPISQR